MDKLIRKIIEKRAIIIFFMVIIVIYGLYSYYIIPKQENPETAMAAATITTIYPGASPEEVEKNVTTKIEEKISSLSNIDYHMSVSMNSASLVIVMYDFEVGLEDVETKLRQSVEDIQNTLPQLCNESVVNTNLVSNNQFIISLSGSEYSSSDLVEYAKTIKSAMLKVDGVESITINGQKTKQLVIETDIEKMKLYKISIENILQLMQAQNLSIPSGSINYENGTINVSSPALFESKADIENLVIGGAEDSLSFVKLKDVAEVFIEDVNDFYYLQDGEEAVLLSGTFEKGKNAVIIGENLRKTIDKIKTEVPENITFHEVMYAPSDISKSINNFILSLLQSIGLIVLVVMIGVRVRNALVISLSLPISILITFIVMNLLKIEFQFISIAALIVSLGILVDNAVVVSEAIQQNLNDGIEKMQSIILAIKRNAIPVLTSTLTTVVTFSIIYFVPGAVGQVAGTIPTVVIASLTASYFMSMLIVPIFAYMYFEPEQSKSSMPSIFSKININKLKVISIKIIFDKLLLIGMKYKKSTITLAFTTLIIAIILALQLGVQFFPYSNKPIVYIDVKGETISLSNTEKIVEDIFNVIKKEEAVKSYTVSIGNDLPNFFLTVPNMNEADNVARFMLELYPNEVKKYGDNEVFGRYLQGKIDETVVGATVEVKNLEYSMPVDAKITLTVTGNDTNKINSVANSINEALRQIEGTDYVRDTQVIPQYQYRVILNSEELSSYGLLKYDVVKQLNTGLMGAKAGTYTASSQEMDIIVRSNVENLEELKNLPIIGSTVKTNVLLGQVSEIQLEPTVPLIGHYNGEKYVNVLSGVLPGYSASAIEKILFEEYIPNIDTTGVEVVARGETKNMMDLISNLGVSTFSAFVIIYIILVLQFSSFKKPINVMTSIPLSLIGCCLGLFIMKMDIQVMALLGLVSLFGIVVNNGILLIEAIDNSKKLGMSTDEACKDAVNQRYRPIMLSSTTTCIGLVPLIVANDPMTAPMASVLLFGLVFATVLTMVVVPVLYSLMDKNLKNETTLIT